MFEPIERKKVYELVAERLVQEISDRRLNPGDELPRERHLAQVYRVGRSSVREALRMLESRGLIAPLGSGRLVVADYGNPLNQSLALLLQMHDGDLRELFEVRRILEVESAGLAASRRTDADLAAMAEALRHMERGLQSPERYVGGDVRFHMAVATATHNRMATHVMRAIRDVLHRALLSIYHIPGSPERSLGQHQRILDAVTARRPAQARLRMRQHLLRVEADVGGAGDRPLLEATRER